MLVSCGALQVWVSAPASHVWLHFAAWAPVLAILFRLPPLRRTLAGWLVGSAAYAFIFAWLPVTIAEFSSLSPTSGWLLLVVLSLAQGLPVAVFALGMAGLREESGSAWVLSVPAWFVVCEFAAPQLFPYLQGVAWYQESWLFLSAAYLGVSWISFLVLACSAWWVVLYETRGRWRSRDFLVPSALVAGLLAVSLILSQLREVDIAAAEQGEPDTVRVAVIQSNIDARAKRRLLRRSGVTALSDAYVERSRRVLASSAPIDALIWPEGAIQGHPREHPKVLELARDSQAEIWLGSVVTVRAPDGTRTSHNSAFRIDSRGKVAERYDKILRVPFGEYVPLEDYVPALRSIRGPGRIRAGREVVLAGGSEGPSFVFLICYEAIHGSLVRAGVALDPDLLVNITYDGWFGGRAPHQHLMLAATQSALHGRPLVRAATTGVSAIVDPRGKIVASTELSEAATLVAEVQLTRVPTLYSRTGDTFVWLCAAMCLVIFGRRYRRQRRRAV